MDKEEFERLKEEEKAHLRQLRDLKKTHRDAQRTASTVNALNAMRNPELEAETDAATDKLMRDAAHAEARFDLALEGDAPVTGNADGVDREALATAEAEALVRQMKIQMGAADADSMVSTAQAAKEPSAPADAKASPASGPGTDPETTDAPTSAAAPLANSAGDSAANAPGRDAPAVGAPRTPPAGADKTIGRAPLADEPPATERGDKSIGRRP